MKSFKKISILCAILLIVSIIMTNFVFATDIDNILDIEEIQPEENVTTENTTQENTTNNTTQENTTQENTTQENTAQENTAQNSTNLTNAASDTTDETKLPQTGITEDYGIMLLAVIFAVASIYAYRKIKQYNVK